LFGNKATVLVTVCVTILCLIGMNGYLVSPDGVEEKPQETSETNYNIAMDTDWLLLPYTALGVAILLSLLFMPFANIFGGKKTKTFGKKNTTSITEPGTKQSDFRKHLRES